MRGEKEKSKLNDGLIKKRCFMLHHWGSIEIDNIGLLLKKMDDYKLLNVKRVTLSMPMSTDVG